MSSPGGTLGSWIRIPLEAWMSVSVYFVFVLSCVGKRPLGRPRRRWVDNIKMDGEIG
jgi:hypothetical protein